MHPLSETVRRRLHPAELEEPETFGAVCFASHGPHLPEAHHWTLRVHAAGGRKGSQTSSENG